MIKKSKISFSLHHGIIFVVVLFSFLLFCSEEKMVNSGSGELTPEFFPHAVGMLWTYEIYDSLTGTTDTVVVSVTDTLTDSSGIFATHWKFNQNDIISNRFVVIAGDTLAIYDDSINPEASEILVFPLSVDQLWTGPGSDDTSWVTENGTISVPAGNFGNGIKIERRWDHDIEGGGKQAVSWFVPNVGIVYRYFSEKRTSGGGTFFYVTNEIWKLIDYDLSTFEIDQFPTRIGTWWRYETYDSSTEMYDTLQVTIAANALIADSTEALLWEYDNGDVIDSHYVVVGNNYLAFYPDTLVNYLGPVYYEFPLAVGRYWGLLTFVPVPEIIEKGPVTAPAGNFDSGFHYHYFGGAFNYYWIEDDWLVPDVGIVSRKRSDAELGPWVTTTWTLLNYQIAR